MFAKMRRNKQLLPNKECIDILISNTSGVLSVLDSEGYPYGVPMSYVYSDNAIYFHCAKEGHKIDAIKNCDKATFCVIAQDEVKPETFSTDYKSVIVFGKISIIEDDDEKLRTIKILSAKYSPNVSVEKVDAEINSCFNSLNMIKLEIENMTGKESLALSKRR